MRQLVFVVVGLCAVLLAACTDDGSPETRAAPCELGSIWVVAGPDRTLYEVDPCRFEATATTVTGVNSMDAHGDTVILAMAPDLIDALYRYADGEVEPLETLGAGTGPVYSAGGPVLSGDGRLAYLKIDRSVRPLRYRVEVVDLDAPGQPPRVVAEYGYTVGGPEWFGDEVTVLETPDPSNEDSITRELIATREIAVYAADGSRRVAAQVMAGTDSPYLPGPNGYIAYTDGQAGLVKTVEGGEQQLPEGWFAVDWSPIDAHLLMANGDRIAISEAPDFAVSESHDLGLEKVWIAAWVN